MGYLIIRNGKPHIEAHAGYDNITSVIANLKPGDLISWRSCTSNIEPATGKLKDELTRLKYEATVIEELIAFVEATEVVIKRRERMEVILKNQQNLNINNVDQ